MSGALIKSQPSIEVNCFCLCNVQLKVTYNELYVVVPCGHMLHRDCVNKYVKTDDCPYCHKNIDQLLSYTQIKRLKNRYPDSVYYQHYVDMSSLSNMMDRGETDYVNLMLRLPDIVSCVHDFFDIDNKEDCYKLSAKIRQVGNISIVMEDEHKLVDTHKVIISNHFNYMDWFVVFELFKCGFIVSDYMKTIWAGDKILSNLPMVVINRDGKGHNTVETIKKYLTKHKSVCIYPEGISSNPKTLIKFRTGAFNTGYPVQPVVVKFDPNFNSDNVTTNLMKTFTQDKVVITVKVLDMEYPPFTPEKIEQIRHKMAKAGDFALSNVSSRDVRTIKN